MSQTCSFFNNTIRDIFTANRPDCHLLLESGKRYTAIINPSILELKTHLIGCILLDKGHFSFYVETLGQAIAKTFTERHNPAILAEKESLLQDKPLLKLLNQHGFNLHITRAFLQTYEIGDSDRYLQLCQDVLSITGEESLHSLETIFEELYAGWQDRAYRNIRATCIRAGARRGAMIGDLKTSYPRYFFEHKEVKGLMLIEMSLLLCNPERETLERRLTEYYFELFERLKSDIKMN